MCSPHHSDQRDVHGQMAVCKPYINLAHTSFSDGHINLAHTPHASFIQQTAIIHLGIAWFKVSKQELDSLPLYLH